MSRPTSVVDLVKDRLSMVDLVGRDVALARSGNHHAGRCPFHDEKSSSFHVWEDHAKCFGSCGWRGDVFTWTQQRAGVDFKEALRLLARQAGVTLSDNPEAARERHEHLARSALLWRAAEHYHGLLTTEALAYLHGRGFTDPFIDDYLIGYAPGDTVSTLAPIADLKAAGLVNEAGRDALWKRITFPVWGRYDDEIVGLAGRTWPQLDREPKFMPAPPDPGPLANERGLRSPAGRQPDGTRVVWLVEGDTDTATAVQAGLPVVGVRGSQRLSEELAPLFARVDTIYVAADADPAGLKLTLRAGELLGNHCRVVELPTGEDVNSFMAAGGELAQLARTAPAFIDWLITRLPPETAPEDVDRRVLEFVPALLTVGPSAREVYTKRLARRLGVTVAPVREQVRETLAARQNGHANGHAHAPLGALGIIWEDKSMINPSQFVAGGAMHTVVFLDRQEPDPETGAMVVQTIAHVASGKHELFPLTETELVRRGLRFAASKVPVPGIIGGRWSTGPDHPYGAKQYLDGGVVVGVVDVYSEVVAYFKRHVDYPNALYHDFLALWTIGTYVYGLHHSYPYCHLHGTKRCGKTLTMEIVAGLAFNAVMSSSMSPAAMYRVIESCSPTVLIDEAEHLGGRATTKKDETPDDRLEILKAGYKAGNPAIRCAGDNHEPTPYDVYSPKMFGSIGRIEHVLGDRMLTLLLARKRPEVRLEEFRPHDAEPLMARTRDKLYCFQLDHGAQIAEQIQLGVDDIIQRVGAYTAWSDLRDRDRELWTPILVLASYIDDAAVEERATLASFDPQDLLTVKMFRLAQQSVVERQARERLDQAEVMILEGTLEFTRTAVPVEPAKDEGVAWFEGKALLDYLRDQVEGLDWLKNARQVYGELEKTTAITRSADLKRRRGIEGGHPKGCVRLSQERLKDVAQRLGARVVATNAPSGAVA